MSRVDRFESEGGFVMLLVAGVVALLALVLLTVARVQSSQAPSVRTARESAAHEAAAYSLAQNVAFLALTEPLGARAILVGGVNAQDTSAMARGRVAELRLDGRAYRAAAARGETAWVSVQDEGGLLSVNSGDALSLAALAEQAGVSGGTAQTIGAEIADFTDTDDLIRAGGAETRAYLRARRAPPPNAPLSSRWDVRAVLNWDTLSASQRALVFSWLSALPQGGSVNVNTAPLAVLAALVGDLRVARSLVARRESGAIEDTTELQGLTGVQARPDGVALATAPGTAFRVSVAFGDTSNVQTRRYEGQLSFATQPDADRPFYWRETRMLTAPANEQNSVDGTASFPRSAALLAP